MQFDCSLNKEKDVKIKKDWLFIHKLQARVSFLLGSVVCAVPLFLLKSMPQEMHLFVKILVFVSWIFATGLTGLFYFLLKKQTYQKSGTALLSIGIFIIVLAFVWTAWKTVELSMMPLQYVAIMSFVFAALNLTIYSIWIVKSVRLLRLNKRIQFSQFVEEMKVVNPS